MAACPTSQPLFNPQMYQGRASIDSPVTLLLKHLPEAITPETLSRLLSHYGASAVYPCVGGKSRIVEILVNSESVGYVFLLALFGSSNEQTEELAFVDFTNEALAVQAQRQLHGLGFLGKVLLVEKAVNSAKNSKSRRSEAQSIKAVTSSSSLMKDATSTMDIFGGSKSHGIPASEPVDSRLGFDYPFPPNLEYAYPPPDGNILTNIVNALIAVPRFYTQVLHLMNKMNITAPFQMALPTPPLPPSGPVPPPPLSPPVFEKPNLPESSSGESETESSDEEVDDQASGHRHKKAKHEAIVGPATDKDIAHEDVGLRSANLVPKEMPIIKKKNSLLQINIAPKTIISEDSNNSTMKELGDTVTGLVDNKTYLSSVELQSGKLPPEEILSLPMFKNYVAGNPASVLYIKNLSKDVVSGDFYFIFGSLFGSLDSAKSGLSVKLMQEGRMRGQAFVTFPSIELAHQALKLVNGYVFRGKPMIIQFGRNPASGKTSSNV